MSGQSQLEEKASLSVSDLNEPPAFSHQRRRTNLEDDLNLQANNSKARDEKGEEEMESTLSSPVAKSSSKVKHRNYSLWKLPFLLIILLVVAFDLVCYVLLRQLVKLRTLYLNYGTRERRKYLNLLKNAKTYEEWVKAGQGWDAFLNRLEWRDELESPFYDFNLIYKVTRKLKVIRTLGGGGAHVKSQYKKLKKLLLESGTKFNLAGIYHHRLHSHVYGATKTNISNFTEEVAASIRFVLNSTEISLEEKKAFLKQASKNYGRTALCLSGGACFAYYHLGVVKALLEQDCLPKIISGTSAGSVMAGYICTHSDQELAKMDAPFIAKNLVPFTEDGMTRMKSLLTRGRMLNPATVLNSLFGVVGGDLTFREAFLKTGRILNVSVTSEDPRKPPVLLNYQTTPHVVIASALLASVAVPGVVPAMPLLSKEYEVIDEDDEGSSYSDPLLEEFLAFIREHNQSEAVMASRYSIQPYRAIGNSWRDGSFRIDIPTELLQQLYNVQFTIASQVNPVINLFVVDRYFFPADELIMRERGYDESAPSVRSSLNGSDRGSSRMGSDESLTPSLSFSPAPEHDISDHGLRGGFIFHLLEVALKLDMKKWVQTINQLELFPPFLRPDLSYLFLQPFHGSVTVLPPFFWSDYWNILAQINEERARHGLLHGSKMVFPKLELIKTRMLIEKEIDRGMDQLKQQPILRD